MASNFCINDDSPTESSNISQYNSIEMESLDSLPGSSLLKHDEMSSSSSAYNSITLSTSSNVSISDSANVHEDSDSANIHSSKKFSAAQNNPHMFNVSVTKVVTNENDLEIRDIELPAHLREDQYDVVLIYCEKDKHEAILFKDIMEKFIILSDNNPCKVCTLDRTVYLEWVRSKFVHLEEAVVRSTYMFLYMSENFVNDAWADLQKDECLQESIDNPEKKWCVVPVHTLPKKLCNYGTPWGLRSLKGIFVDTMLKGKRLKDVEFEEIGKNSLDPFFIKSMTKLLDCRICMKLNRIDAQNKETMIWKKEEKERRYEELMQYKQEEEIREAKLAKIKQLNKEKRMKEKQRKLEEIENMSQSNCTTNTEPPKTTNSNTVPPISSPLFDHDIFVQLLESLKRTGLPEDKAVQQAFLCAQLTQSQSHQMGTTTTAPFNVYNITNSSGISIGDRNEQNITKEAINSERLQNEDEEEVIIERSIHTPQLEVHDRPNSDFEYDDGPASEGNISQSCRLYTTHPSQSSLESAPCMDNDLENDDETNLKNVYTNLSEVNISKVTGDTGGNDIIDSQSTPKSSSTSQSTDFPVNS